MAGTHLPNRLDEEQQQMALKVMATAIGDHWEVQYARFFINPSLTSPTGGYHPSLVPLSSRASKGSWISSFNSLAFLKLLTGSSDHSDASPSIIVTVTLANNVLEEHYIAKLHFTWPQVSCFSGYPPRGSRIVFMSYKDHLGQTQKFAVRFLTLPDTERFINCLKEFFGQDRIDGSTSGISKSKTSSQSEIFSSPQPVYRPTQDWDPISSSADDSQTVYRPTRDWSPITSAQQIQPSVNHEFSQNSDPVETTLTQDVQEKLSAFPPSFTSLLMTCCPATEQARPEEVSLKKEITKYLEDSSFQDMLSKVQKVINEFGDDLLL